MSPTLPLFPSLWQILKRAEYILLPDDYPKWFILTPADLCLYLNSLPTDALNAPSGNLMAALAAFGMVPTLVTPALFPPPPSISLATSFHPPFLHFCQIGQELPCVCILSQQSTLLLY